MTRVDDTRPHPVHGIDAAFLHNETRSTPWHIMGVLVFDPSTARGGFDRDVMARVIAERLEQVEAFRRRIIDVRGVMTLPHWVLDRTVDLAEHVRSFALPTGNGLSGLAKLASALASSPLPRDRPLWQMEVIADIGEGRAAVIAKAHHSIMDGAAAVEILGALFDLEPRPPPEDGTTEPNTESEAPHALGVAPALRRLLRMPVVTALTVAQIPRASMGFVHALRDAGRSVTLPLSGPRTRFNRSITPNRAVGLTVLPLADVREVADTFRLTINDVLMAVCAGALRIWLHEAGDLPDRPLVAALPVALRAEDHRAGNRVSVMFASVPTHLADPNARLEFVRRGMRDAKATHADVRPRTLGALAEAMPWNVIGLLFRVYSDLGLANRLPPAVNLVISNLPGPSVAVYCGGAQLVGLYALGPIFDGTGLNVTFTTCNDDVDVGVVTCPDVAPSLDGLVSALALALGELVALARVPARTEP